MGYRGSVINRSGGNVVTIRSVVARGLFACFLAAAAGTASVPALAQHVVTDDEAGKLTLDALTAAPRVIVRRAAYRPARMSWSEGWSRDRGRGRSAVLLHEASFRRGFGHEASFRHGMRAAGIRATGTTIHLGVSRRRRWS